MKHKVAARMVCDPLFGEARYDVPIGDPVPRGRIMWAKRAQMKHKTAELEGPLLDAAVAKCEVASGLPPLSGDFEPSRLWRHGGPIIEREGIALLRIGDPGPIFWSAKTPSQRFDGETYPNTAATPLIAAMRAYVASKFGEEVEL